MPVGRGHVCGDRAVAPFEVGAEVARHAGAFVEEFHHPGTHTHLELVLDRRDAAADLLPLHRRDVGEHLVLAEVAAAELVHRLRRQVEGRQRDQVVEHAGAGGDVGLERAEPRVGLAA